MSRIYFSSVSRKDAELFGRERAYMGHLISRLFIGSLMLPMNRNSSFFDLISENSWFKKELHDKSRDWVQVEDYLRIFLQDPLNENYFIIGDYKIYFSETKLNTACSIGNDCIKLMATLHGQCDSHCYVEGRNKNWLANIIDKGLKSSLYRKEQGWESVMEFLRIDSEHPVVCSYSGYNRFPTDPKQWNIELQKLRESNSGLELNPDEWDDFYFDSGWGAFKINYLLDKPRERWDAIAQKFMESRLPAKEAWEAAIE